MSVLVWAGRCLLGLGLVATALGWAAWTWFTGGQWFPERPYRRRVARPVRAAGQNLLTAVVVGLWAAPVVTALVVATGAVALASAVAAVRLRRWQAARVRVQVGPVIPHRRPVRPACRPPVAFGAASGPAPAVDRGARTARLVRELEAA